MRSAENGLPICFKDKLNAAMKYYQGKLIQQRNFLHKLLINLHFFIL